MSHKAIAISLTLACCLALAMAAQAPLTETKGQGKEVTLTGCLQAGTEPNSFILKNAGVQAAAGSEAKPAELAKADTEYRLTAAANLNLKDHVGHKVELIGMITGQKQDKPGASEAARMSHFNVKSIKHISPTCP